MLKAYKYRLYPTKEQAGLINKTLGCSRFVYNHFLAKRKDYYTTTQQTMTYNQTSSQLTQLKNELPWLKEVDSIALQQSLRNLDAAFKNFFEKRAGFPRFKSKHDNRLSYRTQNINNNIDIADNRIKLPKIGLVKYANSRNFDGKISSVTVSKTPSGKYYISILVDTEILPLPASKKAAGLDMGLKDFLVTSDGEIIPNPRVLRKEEKKLIKLQQDLSRKEKGSKNRNKARIKLARQHEKVTAIRKDFLHKLSTRLIIENQVICLETLNVKGMIKNRKLAKSISDASWSSFKSMLQYKASWYGRTVHCIDTFYPSSQLCSVCGAQNKETKDLSVREWICQCGAYNHRDLNASKNILAQGLKELGLVS